MQSFLEEYFSTIGAIVLIMVALFIYHMSKNSNSNALSPDQWTPFELIDKTSLSHDVRRFRFALPSKNHVCGLPIGQHISVKFTDSEGKLVIRSYTPTTNDKDHKGYFDICVKVYPPCPPKFPTGGKMSQHLDGLKIGDKILMKGPKGHVDYKRNGHFTLKRKGDEKTSHQVKTLGMIAGGTGITPMLQIIRAIAHDPNDHTVVYLIFANQTEEDIFLRAELEALPKDRFHLWYTLDRPPQNWGYSSGFINAEMCKKHLPKPGKDTFYMVCGPPPMIKYACEPAFSEIGITEDHWFSF